MSNSRKNQKRERNYEPIIFRSLMDQYRRGIFLALFDNPKQRTLNVDELRSYVGDDISLLFPTIEEMVQDGLVLHGMRRVNGKEGQGGSKRTYRLNNEFYDACYEFNKANNKLIERFADFYF